MTIMLFGVSNVGKTTTAKRLAEKLHYRFYDMDEETVKRWEYESLEDFVNTGTLEERDEFRGNVLRSIMKDVSDKVISITPISYPQYISDSLNRTDVITIELRDTPENIFDRLVFSDENDIVYKDDAYKEKYRKYYMHEIEEDLKWYGQVNEIIPNKYDMDGQSPEEIVEGIMQQYLSDLNK